MRGKVKKRIRKALSTPEFIKILTLRTIGNFLVLSSLLVIGRTFYLPVREEIKYFVNQKVGKKYIVVSPKSAITPPDKGKKKTKGETKKLRKTEREKGLLSHLLRIKKVEFLVPEDPNFSVVIPKIGANAKVLANISPADEDEYLAALKKGVAHAAGTAFPGEGGHIFLFAHSTDYIWNVGTYNAIFYLLYKLEKGDEVDLFYKGQRYLYRVLDKRIVDPSQVEYLTRKTNREFLTLQTCWPPGTTLKRLLIFAVPRPVGQ